MSDWILQDAWRQHQAGNLAEAARLYQEVLRANPRHVMALQMFGFLHFQRGEFTEAERLMEQAVTLDPTSPDALYNRGCALQALHRDKDALDSFDKALALKPDYGPAMLNRGNVLAQMGRFEDALASYDLARVHMPGSTDVLINHGNALFELERYAEALARYETALAQNPKHAVLWNNRGNALVQLGRDEDALASFSRALALDAGYADALANRGDLLAKLGRDKQAIADLEKTLALDPRNIDALWRRGRLLQKAKDNAKALETFNRILALKPQHLGASIERGIALIAMKSDEEALAAFDSALRSFPNSIEALSNRANALLRLKRYDEALASADRALALEPNYAAAWHNRGTALGGLKRHEEALACYEKALSITPNEAATWKNRGAAMIGLKRDETALASLDTALRLNPADPEAWSNRARALSNLKRFPEAIADCDCALAIDADDAAATRVAIHSRLHGCDWRKRPEDKQKVTAGLTRGLRVIDPLDHRGISDSEAEHFLAAQLWMAEECPPAPQPLWRGERCNHPKIRLAYLSTDFRAHAVAFLIAGVFEHHDKSRFETIAISLGADDKSETRGRIENAFDRFIDVRKMTDAGAAAMMREMEVDIAVDLNGYTGDSRTGILAARASPVQVNYLGFPGTMAAPYIDYIIADATVIPPDQQTHYSEKVVYLPECYQANDRNRRIATAVPTRAEAGLPEQGFVFCCFNNSYKIGPEIFDTWMSLLRNVQGSVLWLLEDSAIATANLKREAESRGVLPDRLIFAPRRQPAEHLARHRLADLFLDTLPYNAHTTASDALWMGLPLVTCAGNSFPARVAASLLKADGVPELIAPSLSDYEAFALKLAREPAVLASIKAKLAANRDTRPLFDTAQFTRHLESAFTMMWERRQRGEQPASFAVPG